MSWRFLRTPKWVVRHVLVAALLVAMLTAGFWQLRRLSDRQAGNDLIEARQEEPVRSIDQLLPARGEVDDPAVTAALHRAATAVGTYVPAATVVVENRTYNGASGGWVLTPLDLGDGSAVLVNRGFIGFNRDARIVAPPAPQGRIRVEGLLQASQARGRFGPRDPDAGTLATLARVDLPRIDAQLDLDLRPAWLQRLESDPPEPEPAAGAPELVALSRPELSDGPHLSYAFQWFTFTTIALVGYPLLLRRVARDEGRRRRRESLEAARSEEALLSPNGARRA